MNLINENKEWINLTWDKVDKKMQKVAVRSFDKIPSTADENGLHDDNSGGAIQLWTNGFWGGMMWLMYVNTQNEVYKDTAVNSERILDGAFAYFDGLSHDVGFMWGITSGVNYRLNGDEKSRNKLMYTASLLASRFNIEGSYISAWNGEDRQGLTIIDTMMNLPLLYRANEESDHDRFKAVAMAHADMTMKDHIRPDGSVAHIVVHDAHSPDVLETRGGQGYEVGSSWSRGQAWAIYGFALSYIHTGKQEYLDTAKRVAHYFISCCCNDWMPRCDFRSPKEPEVYDSTALCCAACGLIEIANHVSEYEKDTYLSAAINLLKACDKNFCNYDESIDYLVGYGTTSYPISGRNPRVNKPIIYGDYYCIEALSKLRGTEFLPW